MKKHRICALIAAAIVSVWACSRPQSAAMQRIDSLIATGDTVPSAGNRNMFLIHGAAPSADLLDSGRLTLPSCLSQLGAPDSYYSFALDYADSLYIASDKQFVELFFPDVTEFFVDGDAVTAEEFARIPAALLLEVTTADGGKTLNVTTRATADSPSTAALAALDENARWLAQFNGLPSGIPADAGIVLNDLTTWPANAFIISDNVFCSPRAVADSAMREVTVLYLGERPYIYLNDGIPTENAQVTARSGLQTLNIAQFAGAHSVTLATDSVYVRR